MTETLGQRAVRLAHLGAQHLGWCPDTFWQSTPSEFESSLVDPERPPAIGGISRADLDQLLEQERNG